MTRTGKTSHKLALLVSVNILATPALAGGGSDIVRKWIDFSKTVPWLEISAVNVTDKEDTTTVDGMGVRFLITQAAFGNAVGKDPDAGLEYAFTIPQIVFEKLDTDNGYYTASSVTADTINLHFKLSGKAASESEGSYSSFSAAGLRWAVPPEIVEDQARPVSRFYPLVAALADVSAESMDVAAIAISSRDAASNMVMNGLYGRMEIGPVERGNISRATLDNMRMTVEPAAPSDGAAKPGLSISIGPVRFAGYNYGDVIRLFDPGHPPASPDPVAMIGEWTMNDIRASSGDGDFILARTTMKELTARPPESGFLERLDRLVLGAQAGGKPDDKEIIDLVAGIYSLFGIGRLEMAGAAFSSRDAKGSIEETGLSGLNRNGLESVWLKGMDVRGPGGEIVRIGSALLDRIRFPALSALIGFEDARKRMDIVSMMAAFPVLSGSSVSDVFVSTKRDGAFSLKSQSLVLDGHIGPIPTRIHADVDQLEMPVSAMDREPREALTELGYKNINVTYALDLNWQESANAIDLAASVNLKDGGTFALTGKLGSIPRMLFENPMTGPALATGITLEKADARFTDDSLSKRAIGMAARKQNLDPEIVKGQAIGMLPFMLAALNRPDFSTMVTVAAQTFLTAGGSISVSVAPENPVPLLLLAGQAKSDPGKVVDQLKVTVKAE